MNIFNEVMKDEYFYWGALKEKTVRIGPTNLYHLQKPV